MNGNYCSADPYSQGNATICKMDDVDMSGKGTQRSRWGLFVGGVVVFGIGVLFHLQNLGVLPDVGAMFPKVLVMVGITLIVGSFIKSRKADGSGLSPD